MRSFIQTGCLFCGAVCLILWAITASWQQALYYTFLASCAYALTAFLPRGK